MRLAELPENRILLGNVYEVLQTLPSDSVDCMITSPPYFGLRAYGTSPVIWDDNGKCEHEWGKEKKFIAGVDGGTTRDSIKQEGSNGAFCNKCNAWKGEIGLEPFPELYIKHLCDIMDEVKRVLKPTGSCWVNLGDTYSQTGYGGATGNFQNKGVPGAIKPKVNIKYDVPSKCLLQIPSRFALEMCNSKWILRDDLTDDERNYVINELLKRKII